MPSQTSQRISLIDPPTIFAPVEEWREFIAELETSEQTPQVSEELRKARAHVAEMAE